MSEGLVASSAGGGRATEHRLLLILLWSSVALLAVVGLVIGAPLYAVGLTSLLLIAFALGGLTNGNFSMVAVSLGMVAAGGVAVGYASATTFSRFIFLVAIAVISSYRRWQPLVAAVVGVSVYQFITMTPSEAVGHSLAVAILALVLMATWRLPSATSADLGQRDLFRVGFEEAPIGMAVLKPSGEFLEVNRAMADMLGRPKESVVTANISSFVHSDDHKELGEAWQAMGNSATGSTTQWMRWITTRDQAIWGHVSFVLAPRTADEPALVILQLEDAGRSNEERRDLEDLLHGKDEFVAAVGEEIRRPLELLIDLTDQAAHRHVDMASTLPRIEAHARDIASIVDDLVLSARAGTTPVSVVAHQLDAEVLCRDVVIRTPGGSGVELDLRARELWSDPTLTRRIVGALVRNAIKYGGREVVVQTVRSGPDTVIRVSDNGPLIPAVEQERVFAGDLRHGTPVTKPAAVGLSLTMGRYLARLMDGDLEYRRTADNRNVFELRLPSEPFNESPSPPRSATAPSQKVS